MKKRLVLIMAMVMAVQAFLPLAQRNYVFAQGEEAYVEQQLDNLEESKEKLESLQESVKGTGYENVVKEGLRAVNKLESNINTSERMLSQPIYNLDSIGVRVEAFTEAIDAMVYSTQELGNKVARAHRELGFAITKLVIRAADPFASSERIISQVNELKEVINRVSNYPDLLSTDIATVYYKSKIDRAIWNTRFERDKKVLGVKDFQTYNNLNREITKAVGVQLNPRATVAEVDDEIVRLSEALEYAINK